VNFLPIVQRELLVAAKSRRGFRLRMAVAVGATLLGVLTVLGWNYQGGMRAGGDGLFRFLSFLFFLVCCLSGVFLTADCLSREKREGTLGLLFLTDLRGVDIILGKLASTSFMTALMVIGGFPVLALCVLMGGVTGAELFRTCLALLVTMFFSLSVGMFVSTFARESSQASGTTLLLLLLPVIGIPALTSLAGWLSEEAPEVVADMILAALHHAP
jgi:ABC-type transport system involved in multi-copper enzyme maturation permease subunit